MNALLYILTHLWGEPHRLWWLLLLPAVPGLFMYAQWRRNRTLATLGNTALLRQFAGSVSTGMRWLQVSLLTAALGLAILAAARPQWGTITQTVETEGVDIVILLDTSLSMLAEDIKPNRLTAAKHEISSFVDQLTGDRVALVPFAGSAFVQCPLTMDYSAVDLFLREISTRTVPDEGTNLARAMEVGRRAFVQEQEGRHRAMVIVTDGEAHDADGAIDAAAQAKESGIRIYTIGVGSPDGELIPIRNRGEMEFLRDREGRVVKTRLDEQTLQRVAVETDGAYYRASPAAMELRDIFDKISELERARYAEDELVSRVDRYQWPLGASVAFLLVAPFIPDRRRGRSS